MKKKTLALFLAAAALTGVLSSCRSKDSSLTDTSVPTVSSAEKPETGAVSSSVPDTDASGTGTEAPGETTAADSETDRETPAPTDTSSEPADTDAPDTSRHTADTPGTKPSGTTPSDTTQPGTTAPESDPALPVTPVTDIYPDAEAAKIFSSKSWGEIHRWDFNGNVKDSVGGAVAKPSPGAVPFREPTFRNGRIILDGNTVYQFEEPLTFEAGNLRIDVKGKFVFDGAPQGAHRIFGCNLAGQQTSGLTYINIAGAQYNGYSAALSTDSKAWNSFVLYPDRAHFNMEEEHLLTFLYYQGYLFYYMDGCLMCPGVFNAQGGAFIFNDFLGCGYVNDSTAYNAMGEIDYISILQYGASSAPSHEISDDEISYEDKGIYLNIDINSVTFPYLEAMTQKPTLQPADIYPFVDQYKGTQITDISFDIFCQFSSSPSDVWTDIIDIYNRKTENGYSVDYTATVGMFYDIYEKFGINPYTVWINRCRDDGISPWLSFRMNDCHCPDETTVWLRGEEFYEGSKKGWKVGTRYGYQRHCFDYANDEFRARMLAYITEQLMMYDVDGIELDFSREWVCFDYLSNKKCYEIMNQFLRDINKAVKKAETKYGHDIRIKVNFMRDIAQNKVIGLDAETLVKEKLIDVIGVGPRWASNDSDIPVYEWKERFPGVEVWPVITDLTLNVGTSGQLIAGYAASYLAQGADKINLYNMFSNPLTYNSTYQTAYRTCGSLKTLTGKERRIIVTYQDFVPSGCTGWKPLPAKAKSFSIDISTGPVAKNDPVYVIVGTDRKIAPEDLKLFVNGKEVGASSSTIFAAGLDTASKKYKFEIPAEYCTGNCIQSLRFTSGVSGLTISYLEMTVGMDVI